MKTKENKGPIVYWFNSDYSAVHIAPGISCTGNCVYCYIPYLGFELSDNPEPIRQSGDCIKKLLLDDERFIAGEWGQVLEIDTVADPFYLSIVDKTIELVSSLSELGNPLMIITKWNINQQKLNDLSKSQNLYFLVSGSSIKLERIVEPCVPPFNVRLETIRNIKDKGHPVGLYISPVLPGILSCQEIKKMIEMGANCNVDAIIAEPLLVNKKIIENIKKVNLPSSEIEKKSLVSSGFYRVTSIKDSFYAVDCDNLIKAAEDFSKELGIPFLKDSTCFPAKIQGIASPTQHYYINSKKCTHCQHCVSLLPELTEKMLVNIGTRFGVDVMRGNKPNEIIIKSRNQLDDSKIKLIEIRTRRRVRQSSDD